MTLLKSMYHRRRFQSEIISHYVAVFSFGVKLAWCGGDDGFERCCPLLFCSRQAVKLGQLRGSKHARFFAATVTARLA